MNRITIFDEDSKVTVQYERKILGKWVKVGISQQLKNVDLPRHINILPQFGMLIPEGRIPGHTCVDRPHLQCKNPFCPHVPIT